MNNVRKSFATFTSAMLKGAVNIGSMLSVVVSDVAASTRTEAIRRAIDSLGGVAAVKAIKGAPWRAVATVIAEEALAECERIGMDPDSLPFDVEAVPSANPKNYADSEENRIANMFKAQTFQILKAMAPAENREARKPTADEYKGKALEFARKFLSAGGDLDVLLSEVANLQAVETATADANLRAATKRARKVA